MDSVLEKLERQVATCRQCYTWPGGRREACSAHAEQRAWWLLWQHLTTSQRLTLWWGGGFALRPCRAKAHWLITARSAYGMFTVSLHDDCWRVNQVYCAYLTGQAPIPDWMLAQKCWLESDSRQLRRIANSHGRRYSGDAVERTTSGPSLILLGLYPAAPTIPATLHPVEVLYLQGTLNIRDSYFRDHRPADLRVLSYALAQARH